MVISFLVFFRLIYAALFLSSLNLASILSSRSYKKVDDVHFCNIQMHICLFQTWDINDINNTHFSISNESLFFPSHFDNSVFFHQH